MLSTFRRSAERSRHAHDPRARPPRAMMTTRPDAAVMRQPAREDGLAHSTAAVIDELDDLAASDDIIRTLGRSAELAIEVGRWRRPVPLVDALDRVTACGTLVGVLAIELLGAIQHPA